MNDIFCYNSTIFLFLICYYNSLRKRWVNIKLINFIHKLKVTSYNDFNKEYYIIGERVNPYGHVKEFIKLTKATQSDAHRVISPLAIKLFGIEEIYSVTDINGNTYKFDIFEDGDYRVNEVLELKNNIKEAMYETNFNKNC